MQRRGHLKFGSAVTDIPVMGLRVLLFGLCLVLSRDSAAVTYNEGLAACSSDLAACQKSCDSSREFNRIVMPANTGLAKWKECRERCEATHATCQSEAKDLWSK
jgi:hypothetical protein